MSSSEALIVILRISLLFFSPVSYSQSIDTLFFLVHKNINTPLIQLYPTTPLAKSILHICQAVLLLELSDFLFFSCHSSPCRSQTVRLNHVIFCLKPIAFSHSLMWSDPIVFSRLIFPYSPSFFFVLQLHWFSFGFLNIASSSPWQKLHTVHFFGLLECSFSRRLYGFVLLVGVSFQILPP